MSAIPRSSNKAIHDALRVLAREIQSGDGAANVAIAEGADRISELGNEVARLERENAALREKAERYRLVTLKQDAELADWRYLAIWGGTPEVIHEFIRGQQNRIHHCQDLETELAALRSLLREAIADYVSPYDLPEGADYIARVKTALREGES